MKIGLQLASVGRFGKSSESARVRWTASLFHDAYDVYGRTYERAEADDSEQYSRNAMYLSLLVDSRNLFQTEK